MMTYTVIVFVTRNPAISPEEFKDYFENKHLPLLKSLTGDAFPHHFHRRYLARIDREGFGGPANRDHPVLVLRGSPNDIDYDCIAEAIWNDEKTFQRFHKAIYETDTAAKLARDEENFLETGGMKSVVVGEATSVIR